MAVKRDAAWKYAQDITKDRIPAGPHIKAACKRYLNDLKTADKRGFYFDYQAADKAVAYFEYLLKLAGGQYENQPFKLFPWQQFAVRNLYGWKEKKTKYRRFRKAYIETGKGSGKSPMVGGLGIHSICADSEPRAQSYVIARNSEQAKATFEPAVAMVYATPELNERLLVYGGSNPMRIVDQKSMSFLQRVAADHKGRQSGPIPHMVIVDEYHEHETAAMRDLYAAGVKSRRQPMIIMITNAGVSMQSPCGQEHMYAAKIARGEIIDDQYFALIYSCDQGDDPMNDESVWIKANPSLCKNPAREGRKDTVSIPGYRYIRQQVKEARGMPSKRSLVERLNFCRWVDAADPWIDRDVWEDCEGDLSPVEERIDKPCWIGLDLALKTDLCAGTRTWNMGGGKYESDTVIWSPQETMKQRADRDGAPYEIWAEDPDTQFVAVQGKVIDFNYVAKWILDTDQKFNLEGIAYDPWKIEVLKMELDKLGATTTRQKGWPGIYICSHPQGFVSGRQLPKNPFKEQFYPDMFWMPRSVEYTEEAILQKNLKVERNPCLRMAISAMMIISDAAGNRRPTKSKALQRIDPGVSFIMSVGAAIQYHKKQESKPEFDVKEFTM